MLLFWCISRQCCTGNILKDPCRKGYYGLLYKKEKELASSIERGFLGGYWIERSWESNKSEKISHRKRLLAKCATCEKVSPNITAGYLQRAQQSDQWKPREFIISSVCVRIDYRERRSSERLNGTKIDRSRCFSISKKMEVVGVYSRRSI